MLRGFGLIAAITVIAFLFHATYNAWTDGGQDSRFVAAVIGVAGTLATGLGAFWLWSVQHRADIEKDDMARRRRVFRSLVALRAELALNLIAQDAQFGPRVAAKRKAAYLAALSSARRSHHSMPLAVVSKTNDVYDTLKADLVDLPAEVLTHVINYYQLDEYVSEVLNSFASGKFENISIARRENAIAGLFETGNSAVRSALDAYDSVNRAVRERQRSYVADGAQHDDDIRMPAEIEREIKEIREAWIAQSASVPVDPTGSDAVSDDDDGGAKNHG